MKKSCFVLNGEVINVGPWKFDYEPIMEKRPVLDEQGNETGEFRDERIGERTTNPIPDGTIEMEMELVEGADGGLYDARNYRNLRRVAYPDIRDQLDALWKGGADADAMRAEVLAVKETYPKL